MQRFLDITFSLLALLIFSPLLVPIMISLRFSGEGEIFYLQDRVGKDGRHFGLYKFATMLKNSPNMATGTVTVKNDPRILPMGNFLRRTKINELPQLLNIFKGDMSIIGPRPQTPRCFNAFTKDVQAELVKVKPGLSGTGSIVFRNEENLLHDARDQISFYDNVIAPYKGEVEVWYVHNQSLKNYFLLIFVTVWVVFFHSTRIVWQFFPSLPSPPVELQNL